MRTLHRNRSVRKFVRGIRARSQSAVDRGVGFEQEAQLHKPKKSARVSAIERQELLSLVRKAERFAMQQNWEETERCYIQALTINPEAHDVQAELARHYLTTDRASKAEAIYREITPYLDDASCYGNLGLALFRQQKYVESCVAYKEALHRDPTNPERSYALAKASVAAHRFSDAIPLLEKASQRLSRDTELLTLLAECYQHLGHTQEAQETYGKIHRLEPYNTGVKEKLASLASASV